MVRPDGGSAVVTGADRPQRMEVNRNGDFRCGRALGGAVQITEIQGSIWKRGAGEGTRTPDPIITNDVLYQLSYTGTLPCSGPTMAPPVSQVPFQPLGFPHHSVADSLPGNDAPDHLDYTGILR